MASDYPRSLPEVKGGTWAAAHNLVEALIRHTTSSILAVTFRTDLERPEKMTRHDGRLEIRQYPLGNYRSLIDHWGQRRIFKRLVKVWKPDIVHAQGEGLYASLATRSGIPNVYTIHGVRLKELEMDRERLGFLRYCLWAREIRAHHAQATNIIAINEYTRNAIHGLHTARVWEIPNAVRQDLFDLRAAQDSAPEGRILLVGGVRPRKDILTATAVIKALKTKDLSVHLDIVGPNDRSYRQEVQEFIDGNAIADLVTIHGLVDDDELKRRYAAADLLLLTSLEESSPICLVEAMAAGLPIVATNVGGISEMVSDNAILCSPRDIDALSQAISDVLSDDNRRNHMSLNSRMIARTKWSAEAVALATYQAYKEIVRDA